MANPYWGNKGTIDSLLDGPSFGSEPTVPNAPSSRQSQTPSIDSLLSAPDLPQTQERSWGTLASDLGTSLLSGTVNTIGALSAVPALMPGFNRIADPVSQGLGQVAEDINEWGLSDYQKNQNQAFQEAIANSAAQLGEGASVADHLANIKNQGGAAGQFILENPSQALSLTAESLPYLFGGSAVARGLGAVSKLGAPTRAAIGEGTVAAGASTQQIVGDLQDQGVTGWTPERLYGAAAGLGTAGIGRLGAKLQGPVDVDTLLAGKKVTDQLGKAPNAAIGAVKGAGFEAAEELLQGAQEEAFGNLATGRPVSENVGSSALAGSIAGGGIGGLAGAFAGMANSSATRNQSPLVPPAPPATFDTQPTTPFVNDYPTAQAQGQQQPVAKPGAPINDPTGLGGFLGTPEGQQAAVNEPIPGGVRGNVSGQPIITPQSGLASPYVNDVPITPSNNTSQKAPGRPVTGGTTEAIPTPPPTTQGNTAAPPPGSEASKIPVADTFAPNKRPKGEKRPVLLKPRAPAKPKVKRKPAIRTEPKKGKAITDFPSTDPTTQEEVKKMEALVTLAKQARKNKDKALLEETQKAIRAQKVYVSKALRDSYKGQTKAEKAAAKPERQGKKAWLAIESGKMRMSKGKTAPKDADVYVRADNKPGPKVYIDKTKRTKAEQAVEDKILDTLLNYTGLDGKMPIYIYRQNPRMTTKATRAKNYKQGKGIALNPGSLTPGAGGKAVAVNIYIEDYLLGSEVVTGYNIDDQIEQTLAHEIGVHGVMRLGGDKDIGKVGERSGPWPDFWNNVYEENKPAIQLWIKEGGGRGYSADPNGLKAEEWFAATLQGEIADIAEGRAKTYSAKVKRYLRQVQAYLDSLTGKKYTFDQVAEMLVDAAERTVFSTDQTWTGKELWSESKDGVFYVDDVHEWKSREPNSPAATDELYSLIEVGGAKPGYPDKGDNNYAFGAWSGSYLKGVSSWAWGGATKAMVMDGDLNPKEMGELFGKNVHSAFGYLHSKLSGVQGMDLEVAYERPNVGAKKFRGRGRPSVYAKIRRRSDPSVFFQVRVADHVSDLGEKIRTDGPVTIEFANAHLEQFDQSWKDRIDLALDMLRDDGVYKMSPLQAAIDYDINDGFTIKPLSETEITKHGNPKNAYGSELRAITKGKGKLLFERPGVPVPKDLARYGEKDRLELGTFTYQEFLDGHSVSKKMLEGVYFAEVNKGVRKSVTLPDPMDTVELNSIQEFSSADTSIKQVASMLKNPELFEEGSRNLDLGGGKYDLGVEALANHGVESRVMDQFNRDEAHNESVQKWVDKNPVDTVTVANVLNVIKEPEARDGVIKQAYDALKEGGNAYFQVYYDSKKEAGETKAGWQNHKPLKDYLPEVQKHFPDAYIKTVGSTRIIVAPKTGAVAKESTTEADIKALGIPVRDTKRGVGKRMGNDYYVHKSQEAAAIEEFGEARYRNAKKKIPAGFDYDLIHVNAKNGTIEFISSPDWNTANEPVRGEAIKISKEGVTKVAPKKREQIYHHKWSFVGPDYTGFNVQESMNRSASIGEALPKLKKKDPKITSRYGYKDVWESEVESELNSIAKVVSDKKKQSKKQRIKDAAGFDSTGAGQKFDSAPKNKGRRLEARTPEEQAAYDRDNFEGWITDKQWWKNVASGKGDAKLLPPAVRNWIETKVSTANDALLEKHGIDLSVFSISGLGGLKEQKFYLEMRYGMMGNMQTAQRMAERVYNTFKKHTEHHKDLMDYLGGNMTIEILRGKVPANVAKEAETLKDQIKKNGESLVRQGVMKQETLDNNPNYLPRMYLKHVLDEKNSANVTGGARPSSQGYLKKRSEWLDKNKAVRELMGEIVDPGYLGASTLSAVGRDVAIIDFLNDIAKYGISLGWVMPENQVRVKLVNTKESGGLDVANSLDDPKMVGGRTVSAQWLIREVANLDERIANMTDEASIASAKRVRDHFQDLAMKVDGQVHEFRKANPNKFKQYRQVPDSPKYGALAGMWINKRIYNDLFGNGSVSDNKYWRWAENTHAYWKLFKVPLNPPTIARNIMSNYVLMTLDGIPPHLAIKYMRKAWGQVFGGDDAVLKIGKGSDAVRNAKRGRAYTVAEKYGLEMQTFSNQEMKLINDEFKAIQKETGKNPFESIPGVIKVFSRLGKVIDWSGNNYQKVETWQKLAVIEYHLDQGMSDFDAFMRAQDALFDYSLLNQAAKKWRKAPIGSPFLSFSLLATRRLGQVIARHPTRLLWYYFLTQIMWGVSGLAEGVDEDELEKLHDGLPSYIAEKNAWFLIPLPMRDADGRMQFTDLSYIHPFGAVWDMAKQVYGGEVDEMMSMFGMGGAPLVQAAIAISTGEDPFTKRDITHPEYPTWRKTMDWGLFLWRQGSPSFLNEQGAPWKTYLAATDQNRKAGRLDWDDPGMTTAQGMFRFLGINTYAVDPEISALKNAQIIKYRIADLDSQYRKDLRNPNIKDDSEKKSSIRAEWMLQRMALSTELAEMLALSDVHPNLKVKDIKK